MNEQAIRKLEEVAAGLVEVVEILKAETDAAGVSMELPLQESNMIPEGKEPPWITKAKEFIGIDEDEDEEQVLEFARQAGVPIQSSETPWCAAFVGGVLAMCGLANTGTLRARDYANWGQSCEERVGAVVVYKSHVGFVPEKGKVLGGNQSDGVNTGEQRWYGNPIAYRWPEEYQV